MKTCFSNTTWSRFVRASRRSHRLPAASSGFGILMACSLTACLPILHPPGLDSDSRGNTSTTDPARLVMGKTTRTSVLLMLGEPDIRAADDSWFTYRSTRSWGIGGIVIAGGGGSVGALGGELGRQTTQRLLVTFDPLGVVSAADTDLWACFKGVGTAYAGGGGETSSGPCPDTRVTGLLAEKQLNLTSRDYGSVLEQYAVSQWVDARSTRCTFSTSGNAVGLLGPHALLMTTQALLWWTTSSGADPSMSPDKIVRLEDIETVMPIKHTPFRYWTGLRKRDGTCTYVSVNPSTGQQDATRQTAFRQLVIDQINALSTGPEAASGASANVDTRH